MRRHGTKWKAAPPSLRCEVQLSNGDQCHEQSKYAYPAMGGGYMALCDDHAQKHLKYCVTLAAAKRGEVPNAK